MPCSSMNIQYLCRPPTYDIFCYPSDSPVESTQRYSLGQDIQIHWQKRGVYEVLNPLLSSESFGEWCNGKFGTSCDLAGSLNDVVCRRASLAVSQLKGQHAL